MPLDDSLFISDQLYERQVKGGDGQDVTLYLRELPLAELRRYRMAEESADEEVRLTATAVLIASSVRDPDGKQAMDIARAKLLKPRVADQLIGKIMELNNFTRAKEEAAKKPPEASGSGTSSPSPSEADQ